MTLIIIWLLIQFPLAVLVGRLFAHNNTEIIMALELDDFSKLKYSKFYEDLSVEDRLLVIKELYPVEYTKWLESR